ncbi:rRNA maturation RNase YbeY [Stenomitos frigidus]|uniref:Endoribonuclease YbeY n=1 Tax=Stenomitos frigidus ULC18 TaxID=2107698 RepID=A0A2T1E2U6_9CYAN|nr:rRNA maturation RNase YbeY [Stenomitos frigidus]PSB27031.1 rRNA maturation RNase YbeY [Stenomitos frigidus ULC18]
MEVELCVQGCGHESSTHALSDDDSIIGDWSDDPTVLSCPITVERWEDWFQAWLVALQPNRSPIDSYELSLRLTGDREIQSLNQQYRQQDQPTDVLAFAALESVFVPPQELQSTLPLYLGDIVISVGTAQRQADAQKHPLDIELAWLAAHGLLHLLGWDHPDEESLNRMLKQQQVLLESIGLKSKTG